MVPQVVELQQRHYLHLRHRPPTQGQKQAPTTDWLVAQDTSCNKCFRQRYRFPIFWYTISRATTTPSEFTFLRSGGIFCPIALPHPRKNCCISGTWDRFTKICPVLCICHVVQFLLLATSCSHLFSSIALLSVASVQLDRYDHVAQASSPSYAIISVHLQV